MKCTWVRRGPGRISDSDYVFSGTAVAGSGVPLWVSAAYVLRVHAPPRCGYLHRARTCRCRSPVARWCWWLNHAQRSGGVILSDPAPTSTLRHLASIHAVSRSHRVVSAVDTAYGEGSAEADLRGSLCLSDFGGLSDTAVVRCRSAHAYWSTGVVHVR
eukprot:COSAG02_NODE_7031_length_3219_cov_1.591987_2_plen_158_part_00